MKLIKPTAISDAMLLASNVVEGGTALWSSATTYALAAMVGVSAGGVITIYESLSAGNLNHAPASSPTWWRERSTTYAAYSAGTSYALGARVIDAAAHLVYESAAGSNIGNALSDTTKWTLVGATNRWAPFDQKVGTVVRRTGTISYELSPGAIAALALLDCSAESATVVMMDGATEVYNRTISFNVGGAAIDSWYRWFFDPIGTRMNIVFDDLPIFAAATVTVTITGPSDADYIEAGTIVVGRTADLGGTAKGAEISIKDFSEKDIDERFGTVVSIVERGYSKRIRAKTLIMTAHADYIATTLSKLRATPVVFIGEDGFDSLIAYGFYSDFTITLDEAIGSVSTLSLSIEGMSTSI